MENLKLDGKEFTQGIITLGAVLVGAFIVAAVVAPDAIVKTGSGIKQIFE